jgi:phage/plasmid-associated DNA primase
VDETKENGYIYDYLDQISAVQKEELTIKDEVQLFLEDTGLIFHDPEENKGTFKTNHQLYDLYRSWRSCNGMMQQDSMKFFTKLGRFNGNKKSITKSIKGKNYRGYYVSTGTEKTFNDLIEENSVIPIKLFQ